jgi:hypothetical protein
VGGYDGLGMWLGWVLGNEELCDLYRSTGVHMVVKYRRLRWARYVARMYITQRITVICMWLRRTKRNAY